MKQESLTILIAGPGIAGRSTILTRLVEMSVGDTAARTDFDRRFPIEFEWVTSAARKVSVNAAVIGALSVRKFHTLEAINASPWAVHDFGLLEKCDGLLIVLDSQSELSISNRSFLADLYQWSQWCHRDLYAIPRSLAINKVDLTGPRMPEDVLALEGADRREIGTHWPAYYYTCATEGTGVREAFEGLLQLIENSKPSG